MGAGEIANKLCHHCQQPLPTSINYAYSAVSEGPTLNEGHFIPMPILANISATYHPPNGCIEIHDQIRRGQEFARYPQQVVPIDSIEDPYAPDDSPSLYSTPTISSPLSSPFWTPIKIAKPKVHHCPYDICTKSFSRRRDRDRHILTIHNRIRHHCLLSGCPTNNNNGQGYCREEKLKSHLKRRHYG